MHGKQAFCLSLFCPAPPNAHTTPHCALFFGICTEWVQVVNDVGQLYGSIGSSSGIGLQRPSNGGTTTTTTTTVTPSNGKVRSLTRSWHAHLPFSA